MNNLLKWLGVLFLVMIAGVFLRKPFAMAELIQIKSKVIEINAGSNYLKVDQVNSSGEMKEIKIDIERSTHFEIYTTLDDVKVGDDVAIQTDFNAFNHEWKAISIAPYNENSAQKILNENAASAPLNSETSAPVNALISR